MTDTQDGMHRKRIGDKILLIVLAVVLIGASIAVTAQFMKPGSTRESLDSITQDCLGIISAAQKWYRSSRVVGGAERRSWKELTFDKIGYIDQVGGDRLTMTNSNARFTIRIAPDGGSFDLIAEGREGRMVIYRGVTDSVPPDPEIR